jgi:transposase InsO family protein
MWVVVLGSKGEAADAIRRAQAAAEAECGRKLRVLRIDNNGEFTAAEFASYCADDGVQRHYSALYNPQQNGATRRLWGWLGPSSSRGECRLSSGERRW